MIHGIEWLSVVSFRMNGIIITIPHKFTKFCLVFALLQIEKFIIDENQIWPYFICTNNSIMFMIGLDNMGTV